MVYEKSIFYYVHTGHRFGLERFRRAIAIINELKGEYNITLLTSDYRIASSSREYGVEKAIGLDVLRNIPNVAEHGDILIYDSTEHNDQQIVDMVDFFSTFIRISDNPNDKPIDGEYMINPHLSDSDRVCGLLPIESKFFGDFEKSIERLIFFGDADYDKDLLSYSDELSKLNSELLLGFYYFLGYEDELSPFYSKFYENEEYDEVIEKTEYLITSSHQSALSSLATGGKPIYIERLDVDSDMNSVLESYGIPVLKEFDSEKIEEGISNGEWKKISNPMSSIKEFLRPLLKTK